MMHKINRLLKKYDCHTYIVDAPENPNTVLVVEKCQKASIWPESFLPLPNKLKNPSPKALDEFEEASRKNLALLPDKKIVYLLTSIDVLLVREIRAEDLISYTSSSGEPSLLHLYNSSKYSSIWFRKEFDVRRLLKLAKLALEVRNYNLVNIIIKGLQAFKLNEKEIKKLSFYKNMLKSQENGIFPFEWLLKDCEDSNMNINSEIASLRFCKIIEKLKEMKGFNINFNLKEKHKIMLFSKMFEMSHKTNIEVEKAFIDDFYLYLVI